MIYMKYMQIWTYAYCCMFLHFFCFKFKLMSLYFHVYLHV